MSLEEYLVLVIHNAYPLSLLTKGLAFCKIAVLLQNSNNLIHED